MPKLGHFYNTKFKSVVNAQNGDRACSQTYVSTFNDAISDHILNLCLNRKSESEKAFWDSLT